MASQSGYQAVSTVVLNRAVKGFSTSECLPELFVLDVHADIIIETENSHLETANLPNHLKLL